MNLIINTIKKFTIDMEAKLRRNLISSREKRVAKLRKSLQLAEAKYSGIICDSVDWCSRVSQEHKILKGLTPE